MTVDVKTLVSLAGVAVMVACSSRPSQPPETTPAPANTSTGTATPIARRVLLSDSFSPRSGDAAIRAFVPDVAPVDSGGECMLTRTGGSGATIVSAAFPTRTSAHTRATITFDSAGHLVRYSEQRGAAKAPSMVGMTDAQRDSTLRQALNAVRSTNVSLDYAIDQAVVSNRGGGRPTDAIIGNVRQIENLEKLGPLTKRIERIRKLCGV
jgi:hypothetical protein